MAEEAGVVPEPTQPALSPCRALVLPSRAVGAAQLILCNNISPVMCQPSAGCVTLAVLPAAS